MIRTYRKSTTIQAEQFARSQKMIKKYGIEDSKDSGYNDSYFNLLLWFLV